MRRIVRWLVLLLAVALVVGAIFFLLTKKQPSTSPGKNGSEPSTQAQEDKTPPTVSVTSVTNGEAVSGEITVRPEVSDNIRVTRVEYYVDGIFSGVSYAAPFEFKIDTRKYTNGEHKLLFKAFDAAGNQASSQEIVLNINNPTASVGGAALTSGASQRSVVPTVSRSTSSSSSAPDTQVPTTPNSVSLSASDGYTTNITWTASSDNIAVSSYRIFRDGVQIGTSTAANYTDQTVVPGNTYTYKVQAVDAAGNSSGFSTEPSITLVTTSVWINGDTPQSLIDDTGSIELGVKFKPRVSGQITGIRFYKMSGDTATHTGTLWKSDGTQLATVTFTGESSSGWQDMSFGSPVEVTANTTYVASYFNPDAKYAYTSSYFSVSNGGITSEYLSAPGSGGSDGSNGVYKTSAGFPNTSFGDTNYWVDVKFAPVKGSSGPSAKLADNSKTYTNYPGSNNTGVPAGKRLPRRDRAIDVRQPNTTIENIEVTVANGINVFANNATIKNTRVAATTGASGTWAVRQGTGVSGMAVQDSEFYGTSAQQIQYGIYDAGSNLTALRVNISCYANGIQANTNVNITDSFVHDPCYFTGDHDDAFIATGGDTIHLDHNTLHNNLNQTAAVGLFCDFSPITNATINNNLLIGGGYSVYAGSSGTGCASSHDNKFTNNKFSREVWSNGGFNGPVTGYTALTGNVWTNNTWYDDGTAVNP